MRALELEPVSVTRIVAPPGALDRFHTAYALTLRLAPDELLVVGDEPVGDVDDPHAIVVDEHGLVGAWLTDDDVREHVAPAIEWALPPQRPGVAQGLIAGVPAKLWLGPDRALLLCASALAHELSARLNERASAVIGVLALGGWPMGNPPTPERGLHEPGTR